MSTLAAPPPNVPAILTQTLDEFVKQQVAERELADETAYFEKLAEAEQQRKIWDYYEQEVLRGLNSGSPIPLTPDFWDEIREEVKQRLQAQQAEETA
jgi:hypothetical protein